MATVAIPPAGMTALSSGCSLWAGLPYTLDLACPPRLSSKSGPESTWPFPIPSQASQKNVTEAFKRRYIETLYLPELISPLEHWATDVKGMMEVKENTDSVRLAILSSTVSLALLETRHRKTLLNHISRWMSMKKEGETESGASESSPSSVSVDELEALQAAVELRMDSRSAAEGKLPSAKSVSTEFERREALMQVILLLMLMQLEVPAGSSVAETKRKRKRSRSETAASDDPSTALELLMDRIGVWNAVAELGIGLEDVADPKGSESSLQMVLESFWRAILVPQYLKAQPEACSSFHLKVFGRPMPSDLMAAPSTIKKPRKPKITRSRPPADGLVTSRAKISASSSRPSDTVVPVVRRNSSSHSQHARAASRGPSEAGSRTSDNDSRTMRRSLSNLSESMPDLHRARSRSIDPPTQSYAQGASFADTIKQPKKFGRAPSGADLFKGRQVGLLRRTASLAGKKDKETMPPTSSESQNRGGLLGRKISDSIKDREASRPHESQQKEGTLIFATPSKPRLAETIFGPRVAQFQAPTPIQEEPSSGEKSASRSFVVETPVHGAIFNAGRMAFTSSSTHSAIVLDTPEVTHTRVAETSMSMRFAGMPISQMTNSVDDEDQSDATYGEDAQSEGSDDPLADLMVMTDEEYEEEDGRDVVHDSPG
ncbi:hypothetical protein BD324DRAFT_648061 [Kockovaella imperatae]|uniref:DNA replication regulator Sld3 C-terminal domain-containing protein n=1 Tax=Kockovaella imperatae TaxID=4999 RepID=A0A1Y1UT98_9TREE|nr:hypothetical protein BD324DRAFT_648061 [Kockovaella imperatae]ORX41172.1 hypothetical protein BD324DRAFT_648061 [Kockovaella imperatae]